MTNVLKKMLGRKAKPESVEKKPEPTSERTIPPHVVACKVCSGTGLVEGETCWQCKGSGRVIVSHEVKTFVSAFVPEVVV